MNHLRQAKGSFRLEIFLYMLYSINPYTQEPIGEYKAHENSEILTISAQCESAAADWKRSSEAFRMQCMQRLSEVLVLRQESLANLISQEMGKPIAQSMAEITKCAHSAALLAQLGTSWLNEPTELIQQKRIYRHWEPKGVLLLLMPWNFPFWQVMRCALPALMAGNSILLKHAPNVSGCSLALENLFHEAGFPTPVFRSLFVENDRATSLLQLPAVKGVYLTGSTQVGRWIAEKAGNRLIPCVFELGGSDPFIVLEDMDLHTCIAAAAEARLQNSGQSCIAAKRFLIPISQLEQFTNALEEYVTRHFAFGNPLNAGTTLGPLARLDLAQQLKKQVQEAETELQQNSRQLLRAPDIETCCSVRSIVLSKEGSRTGSEEFFGPVFLLIPYRSQEELIRFANETPYGLGASIWTQDIQKAFTIASELHCGNVYINDLMRSDMHWPFGGIKDSGYGKELGKEGMRQSCNLKILVGPL